jgi:23S rRNA maturation-related 3'-5' exoribonuclease YhaM
MPQVGQYWDSVTARPNVFQGKEQLIISAYGIVPEDELTVDEKAQFEEPPAVDVDRVLDRMFRWSFWDWELQVLMAGVVSELTSDGVFNKIRSIPAGASYHHSVKGGFLLHIDELLNFADHLCGAQQWREVVSGENKESFEVNGIDHYQGVVDYQILRAAIVLHDIGKVYDYDAETLQYQENPVSDCLEHTLVGVQLVDRHWPKQTTTPEEIDRELRLKYAIAAHHGKEMGAVVPKTPEAILLHHLDMISASLDVCRRAYREAKSGAVPEYSRMLGARPFVPRFFPTEDRVIYRSHQEASYVAAIPGDAVATSHATAIPGDAVATSHSIGLTGKDVATTPGAVAIDPNAVAKVPPKKEKQKLPWES